MGTVKYGSITESVQFGSFSETGSSGIVEERNLIINETSLKKNSFKLKLKKKFGFETIFKNQNRFEFFQPVFWNFFKDFQNNIFILALLIY